MATQCATQYVCQGHTPGVKLRILSFRCIETAIQRADWRRISECKVQSLTALNWLAVAG